MGMVMMQIPKSSGVLSQVALALRDSELMRSRIKLEG